MDAVRSSVFLWDPALLATGWSGKPNSRAGIGQISFGKGNQSPVTDTIKFRSGGLQAQTQPLHVASARRNQSWKDVDALNQYLIFFKQFGKILFYLLRMDLRMFHNSLVGFF